MNKMYIECAFFFKIAIQVHFHLTLLTRKTKKGLKNVFPGIIVPPTGLIWPGVGLGMYRFVIIQACSL